jgi:hypothetical protein
MLTNGYQDNKYPIRKMRKVLLRILPATLPWPIPAILGMVNAMALPTANKKEGKTRSVGVKPCQEACSRGSNGADPAWLFTMIMKHTVIPLKTSRAVKRWVVDMIEQVGWFDECKEFGFY